MARKICSVCQLPDEVRAELATLRASGVTQADQVTWLHQGGHTGITIGMLDNHRNRRHETPDGETSSSHEGITTPHKEPDIALAAAPGLSADQQHRRVIEASLRLVDSLQMEYSTHRNLRVARVLTEAIKISGGLLADMDYEGTDDDPEA